MRRPTWRVSDHLRVMNEGLSAVLPEQYNSNAMWYFELPGGLLAYYCMRQEAADARSRKDA
jgi:hypothetical protein